MKNISVLDTTITSYNLGNEIIMESIRLILNELFPEDFIFSLPWTGNLCNKSHYYMKISEYVFFGGTNSLTSHMLKYKQMGFRVKDLLQFHELTLLGMGWWQYQERPDLYTRIFLKRLLSNKTLHSVRDNYTKKKLNDIGISNVLNTSCPTTWSLTAEHCTKIPKYKGNSVIVTLTDYNKSKTFDRMLLNGLIDSYKNVFYWVQGLGDFKYIKSMQEFEGKIKIIPPNLSAFDSVLVNHDCDYIGTRLHAGIRSIQHKKRALILAVDNRATELGKDIEMNVKARKDILGISNFINGSYETKLNVPFIEINRWKDQFK